MVCSLIGDRTLEEARAMLRNLAQRIEGEKFLFTTDELFYYKDAILEEFHYVVHPEPTGSRGRPQLLYKEINNDIELAHKLI